MFEQDALRGDLEQRSGRGWTASAVGAEKVFYTLQQPTELSPACTGKSNFICNVFYSFTRDHNTSFICQCVRACVTKWQQE